MEKKMIVGYARVSTQEQDNQAQTMILKENGCEIIFEEKASGGEKNRPQLQKLLKSIRQGDMIVVWKIDRLSRSLKDLLLTLEKIEQAGAHFKSLTEPVDTSTSAGRMMMQIIGSFAEFERAILRERTKRGLEVARKNGRFGGRKPKLSKEQHTEIINMVLYNNKSCAEVGKIYNVNRSTIYRIISKGKHLNS